MKKSLLIASICTLSCAMVVASIASIDAISKAINAPKELSSKITASKPGLNETTSFLPEALNKFWNMEDLYTTYASKAPEIGELTPYCDDLAKWQSYYPSNKAKVREYFDKYDLFVPTNNTLAWVSEIDAKEYKVIISQDKSLKQIEREYTVSGDENSVVFENPYTGTNYYWQVIATKGDDSKVYSDIFNFTSANLPRTVLIEGISNTRDLGGNVGLNNKKIKQGLIYRGSNIECASENGENEFKNNLGIKTELDLRGIGEGVENYFNLQNYYHYPSPYAYTYGTASTSGIEYMGEGSLVKSFGNAVKVLANKDNYPVFFHCAVGRDRTGWMGLCLNLLCGVSKEVALKEFCLSLFSTTGAYIKGNTDFYKRVCDIVDYLNTFNGNNLSEKTEDYLVSKAGVTHAECENVRKILLGETDTGFVPGKVNPEPYTNLAKVTFRKFGESSVIKMVDVGSKLEKPSGSENGDWYNGSKKWDFDNDVVNDDVYLDFVANNKIKVLVQYSGINLAPEMIDIAKNSELKFSRFEKDGYTFKVYDEDYNELKSLIVTESITINVVYKSTGTFAPKANSRIVVMAGQSNGAGVGHYQFLSNSLTEDKILEINNGYENVQMMGYSHSAYYDTFRKVYADKDYSSAGAAGTFGFEVGLADRLSKVFPDETTYIVKAAYGATSLNYDWTSPSSMDTDIIVSHSEELERGWLYNILVKQLTSAISMISAATNTIPMVEAFMWMQGESDASFEEATNIYASCFDNLVNDFVGRFEDNISTKFTVYDAAISETSQWPLAKQMNALKRARVNEQNVYLETNERLTTLFEPVGNTTDHAHYDAACYIDLGHMFADAYLEKTVRGYAHNAIEITPINSITLKLGETFTFKTPKVYFNGELITNAKLSYFAQQHTSTSKVFKRFTVDEETRTLNPVKVGSSLLRITAYYQDEVRTILIPVEIVD